MKFPKTQKEFEQEFNNEFKCFKYLFDIKYDTGYVCQNCGSINFWLIKNRYIRCKDCKHEISFFAGTIFQNSNLLLIDLFRIIWWMVSLKNGISAKSLENLFGISYKTSWVWLHKFRRTMVLPEREKLKGNVEVDETFVGGVSKGKRGRGAEGKTIVIIAVEVLKFGTGRTRLAIIPDASRKSLNKFLKENIEPNSVIITDAWKGYSDVNKMNYIHEIKNQTKTIDEENLLPNVHRIASLIKRWLLGTHQSYLNKGNLEFYLDEFTFRYNRRKSKSRGKLFYTIIYQALKHEPILNTSLIKKQIK
jgi:transposase-like protein/DNA-directed RNA polymerase subunit RPC12/RpoP